MVDEKYEYRLQVRWSDSDRLGHVNNTRVVEYLQEARAHFVTDQFLEAEATRGSTVVRKLTVEYLRPVFDDSGPLVIGVSVTHIGRTSFGIRHRVRDTGGALCADAEAVMVAFDLDTQQPRPLTEREKSVLARYAEDSGSLPEIE